jgi:hypothetical protein
MPRSSRLALHALLALLVSAALAGAFSAAAGAGTNQVAILQDDAHALTDPVATMATLRSLGVTDVRIFVNWGSIAPHATSRKRPSFNASDPGAYPAAGWARYDAAIQAATADGIRPYLDFLGPAPLWATTVAPRGTATHNPAIYEPSAQQFGQFVAATGKRYDGTYTPAGAGSPLPLVSFWGIWNEPNYGQDLAPQAIHGVEVSPLFYRGLLDSAWSALHATGHGHDTILIGETAPRGAPNPGVANGLVPLRFIRALYCVNTRFQQLRGSAAAARGCPTNAAGSRRFAAQNPGLFQASGFADHMYTSGQVSRPNLPTPSFEPDYAGLFDIKKLERTLDRVAAVYGSHTHFPIYNTEFGFQTDPPKSACGCVFLNPTTAAYYMNWSEWLMWSDPRISSYSQYLLYDGAVPGHPNESAFSSGLLFSNGTAKPGYDAFVLPLYLPVTSAGASGRLLVWGAVRPAPYAQLDTGSQQQVQIQFQPAAGGAWTTLSTATITTRSGYFQVPVNFPASGSVRLQWTYPSAFAFLPPGTTATVTSRTQTITVG